MQLINSEGDNNECKLVQEENERSIIIMNECMIMKIVAVSPYTTETHSFLSRLNVR